MTNYGNDYYQHWRAGRKANGLCLRCPEVVAEGKRYCKAHLEIMTAEWQKRKVMMAEKGLCQNCGMPLDRVGSLCAACSSQKSARYYRLKDAAFLKYGGYKCSCCGESEKAFLVLDHVNNDGNEHRRQLKKMGHMMVYQWLKNKAYPDGFQVLCSNCNFGKRICGGVCPHKLKVTANA